MLSRILTMSRKAAATLSPYIRDAAAGGLMMVGVIILFVGAALAWGINP